MGGPPERDLVAEIVQALQSQIETELLGSPRTLTRAEACAEAGISVETGDQLWRALGFASVTDEQRIFTENDVNALRIVRELTEGDILHTDELGSVTRMLGQSMSRLADWQGRLFADRISTSPDLMPDDGDVLGLVNDVMSKLEQVQTIVWRRHLAAAVPRLIAEVADVPGAQAEPRSRPVAVGFADMTGYTSLTRRVNARTLAEILETFEALAADLAAEHSGRIVKTLGDEVLFVAESAASAAEIALGLLDATEADDRLPSLRTGMAAGEVLTRFGDVFGPVVNIASRLTTLARPGTALIDRQLADALDGDERFSVRPLRRASVQGYSRLRPFLLRRSD